MEHCEYLFSIAELRKEGVDPNGYVIDQIRQDVFWLGHSQVTIRGDNEPALVQVIDAALAALKVAGVTSACGEGSVSARPSDQRCR